MLDYLIVGCGLAGMHMAYQLEQHKRSFTVIDSAKNNATQVAGGVNNPLILKRFTKSWRAEEFIPTAKKTYRRLEQEFQTAFYHPISIYRKIHSPGEQNDWFYAAQAPSTGPFMSDQLEQLKNLPAPYKYGKVAQSSLLDTEAFSHAFKRYLKNKGRLKIDNFDYKVLRTNKRFMNYKNIKARKIIFCEGYGLIKNPFFNDLPLRGNKGEYLIVKAPDLAVTSILKTSCALIPLGQHNYKFGASYDRNFNDTDPDLQARRFLIKKLKELIGPRFRILETQVGIRPTVRDRRPLLGRHPDQPNMFVFNGLGSHGVMIAPTAAKWLYDFDNYGRSLPEEVDINRYYYRKTHHLKR